MQEVNSHNATLLQTAGATVALHGRSLICVPSRLSPWHVARPAPAHLLGSSPRGIRHDEHGGSAPTSQFRYRDRPPARMRAPRMIWRDSCLHEGRDPAFLTNCRIPTACRTCPTAPSAYAECLYPLPRSFP
jgi:hypothetical protein